jgi:hypothetical protein
MMIASESTAEPMQLPRLRPILLLFALGAIAGTALDAIHAHNQVERYPTPVLFGVAWWVPLLFGAAAVAIGVSHPFVDPLLHQRRSPPLINSIAELAWLLLAYLLSAGALDTFTKTGLLLLIYLNFWLLSGHAWQNLVFSIATAITGTLIEMILVSAGAFAYLHPDWFGVPYWLPCIYAIASLAVGDMGRSFILASGGTH